MKPFSMFVAFAAMVWFVAQQASAQGPPNPPAGGAQEGRGGRGGGQRGPNFPQQQRPPGDPAVITRGQSLYRVHCTACHGMDLRGGDQGGPNLLRSEVVLTDQKGELISAVVRSGRRSPIGMMPPFQLPDADTIAIAEYIHSVMARAGRQGRPPESETPAELNVLVGDAKAGEAYFNRTCSQCHSTARDLEGIASRIPDPRELQNRWVSGSRGGGGRGGRGGGGDADDSGVKVTVTPRGGPALTGRLVRIDDFIVTLIQDDGQRRTFTREAAGLQVAIEDRREAHRRMVLNLADKDMHNVTAFLATLK